MRLSRPKYEVRLAFEPVFLRSATSVGHLETNSGILDVPTLE